MNEGIEAIADIATGAVAATAIEPNSGSDGDVGNSTLLCANCGCILQGAHCHVCGQKAKVQRTLAAFGHDFLHSILHFEGKIWRTLPMLALHPGQLTRRYVHGERARFISPLALFLFSVFLMFAVVGQLGDITKLTEAVKKNSEQSTAQEMAQEAKDADTQIAELIAERENLAKVGKPTKDIDAELFGARTARRAIGVAAAAAGAKDAKGIEIGIDEKGEFASNTGWAKLDKAINYANKNRELTLYKIQSSAYKYSWALIPLSLPFMWLLFFWRREFHLYDHVVFVTYSLCFMTMWAAVFAILGSLDLLFGPVMFALFAVPAWHLYRQLKDAYGLSRRGAILRWIVLLFFVAIISLIFMTLLILLGVMG
jgi:Protein of unknown function (DUF3667)